MDKQTALLPRAGIIEESRKISFAVLVKDEKEMVKVANGYASEHLEIITGDEADELRLAGLINNAGSIFLGALSSEPLGDYASGANHTLPTSGFAKAYSALSANSFGKMIQIQRIDAEGIRTLEPIVAELARMEGLQAHGRAVTIRVEG
jgi:histidinol dehydrogenase